ncbi:MAG: outer membrane protein assembly factor BamA [Gammaproteobacteria bacterium]
MSQVAYRLWIGVILSVLPVVGLAALPDVDFVVSDVEISGLERVSLGSIFRILPIQPGDRIDHDRIQHAARQLFATEQFDDIQFKRQGSVLHVLVEERPWIQSIEVSGNKAISETALLEGLSAAGLAEGEVFRRATIDGIRQELLRQYVGQGRYTANIETEVTPKPQNQVAVKITIDEGSTARIRRINFIGNADFSDSDLQKHFQLSTGSFFSFLSGNNKYSREKLGGDLESLRSFYLNRGYAEFRINSVDVSISDVLGGVYISISLFEGPIHRIGDIKFSGNPPLSEAQLQRMLLVANGYTFSQSAMVATEDLITRRLNDLGYSFATVNVVPDQSEASTEEQPLIDLTVYIDTGKRTYVRRINFSGNAKTLDSVLRREMRQMEGSASSAIALERSRLRLERSGYFQSVDMETIPVPGTEDQIDVSFSVTEELSGSLSFNLGYSEASGTFYNLSLDQNNFLGTGKQLGISASQSSYSQALRFNLFEPYYTLDGLSLGFGFSLQELDNSNFNIAGSFTDTIAATFSLGALINDQQRIQFTFGLEDTKIAPGTTNYRIVTDLLTQSSEYQIFKLGSSWNYSTLNRSIFPTSGSLQSVSLEVGAGTGLDYYAASWQGRFYYPLGSRFSLVLRQRLGVLGAFDNEQVLPFFRFYRAGGLGSVRGYRANSLGAWSWGGVCPSAEIGDAEPDNPNAGTVYCDYFEEGELVSGYRTVDLVTSGVIANPIGSDLLYTGSVELIVPTPFAANARSVRTVVYFDYGDAYSSTCDPQYYVLERCRKLDLTNFSFNWSAGMALTWITAFGPLNFVLAYTPDQDAWHETDRFDFSLGSYF